MTEQDQDRRSSEDDDDKDLSPVPPTVVGWAMRIFSVVLIAGLLTYLLLKALAPQEDFRLTVEQRWAERSTRNGQSLVPVEITNDSSVTVRNLRLELLPKGQEPVEVEILLFGPGEQVTYVIDLERSATVGHRVLSYER